MSERRRTLIVGFVSGLIGAIFMVLLMLVLRYFTGATSLPELILDRGAPFIPIPVFFKLLGFFGGYSELKEIGVVSNLLALVAFAGIVGAAYAVKVQRAQSGYRNSALPGSTYGPGIRFLVLVLLISWVLSVVLLWPVLDGNFKGLPSRQALALNIFSLLSIYLFCGALLVCVHRILASESHTAESRRGLLHRRTILAALMGGIGIASVVSVLRK